MDPQSQAILHTEQVQVDLTLNNEEQGQFVISTLGFALKTYTLMLQVDHQQQINNLEQAQARTLATASFTVKDGLPPELTIMSPADGSLHHAGIELVVSAIDDASGIDLVQYRIDTGQWRPLPAVNPDTGTYGSSWNPVEEDEGAHTIYFRATDKAGNVSTPIAVDVVIELYTAFEKLTGTLAVEHNPVYRGQQQGFMYELINGTNKPTDSLTVRVLIVDPDTGDEDILQILEGSATVAAVSTAGGTLFGTTLELMPKQYKAVLEVDSDEADEIRTLAEVVFQVVASVEADQAFGDPANVLVWVNDNCQSEQNCVRVDLLEDILSAAVAGYYIVYDRIDFETELRNPFYTDILILGDQQPLTDHHAAELQEKVFSGTGLISSHWLKHGSEVEMFGISYKGQLPDKFADIQLLESSITAEGSLLAEGKTHKVEIEGETEVAGWISDGKKDYPAIVLNDYGLGNTIFSAFDLGLTLNDETYGQLGDLITASIQHVHQVMDTTVFYPYQFVPVDLEISGTGIDLNLEIAETFAPELALFDPASGQWINDNPWITNLQLEAGQAELLRHYYLMPDLQGGFQVETDVYFLGDSASVLMDYYDMQLPVEHDITALVDQIIADLNLLVVDKKDEAKVKNAVKDLEKVRDRAILSAGDIDQNIHDILKAIEGLRSVESMDVSDTILKADTLLRCEQGWYYFYE
jgi:hypothetical protein